MSSEGTLAVAAMVVALVQLWKWAGLRDSWAPLAVILLSVVGVVIWLVSGDSWPPARTDIWPILTGIIAVTLSSAGTFGFTRAGASAVTSLTSPPVGGAGSEPSIKSGAPTTPTADEIAQAVLRARAAQLKERFPDGPADADAPPAFLARAARQGDTVDVPGIGPVVLTHGERG